MAYTSQMYEDFKGQNPENGFLDVTFEVEKKLIRAHKCVLGLVSDVFKQMISDTWNNGESIQIKNYSFNVFYQFLTFIYSGSCELSAENIFSMVDISEFYQVESFQQKCDEYLSQKEYTPDSFVTFFEQLSKYSLPKFLQAIQQPPSLLQSSNFIAFSKGSIEKIVSIKVNSAAKEKIFEKVYEWSEFRALKKQSEFTEGSFNLNDAIKAEIFNFLQHFDFKNMRLDFLHSFVVERGFLFSYKELSEILKGAAKHSLKVKITNKNGQSLSCYLPCCSGAIEVIKSLKDINPRRHSCEWISWSTTSHRPSTPSPVYKRYGVKWYLAYFNSGNIGITEYNFNGDNYYLLAEMIEDTTDFIPTDEC